MKLYFNPENLRDGFRWQHPGLFNRIWFLKALWNLKYSDDNAIKRMFFYVAWFLLLIAATSITILIILCYDIIFRLLIATILFESTKWLAKATLNALFNAIGAFWTKLFGGAAILIILIIAYYGFQSGLFKSIFYTVIK